MQEEEQLSVDDILATIRGMLTDELNGRKKPKTPHADGLLTLHDLDLDTSDTLASGVKEDVFLLEHPIEWASDEDSLSGADLFVLTPDMRVDIAPGADMRQQARRALMKMAKSSADSTDAISLTPEAEKRMRILLNEWLKKNLPPMIEQVLNRELNQLKQ